MRPKRGLLGDVKSVLAVLVGMALGVLIFGLEATLLIAPVCVGVVLVGLRAALRRRRVSQPHPMP